MVDFFTLALILLVVGFVFWIVVPAFTTDAPESLSKAGFWMFVAGLIIVIILAITGHAHIGVHHDHHS
jgi:hypothetical protein